jgi:hypothetical protein
MNTKAYLAALAGAVFSFLGGWVFFGIVLTNVYSDNSQKYDGLMKTPMPDLPFIFISGLALSFLITIIYVKWANVKTFGEGFTNGLLIYFLYACAYDFNSYGFMNLLNLKGTIIDILAQTVFGGVVGGTIGAVLGMGKKD